MSATRGTKAENRDPLDRYYTPAAWCDAVIARWTVAFARLRVVVEPSAGRGMRWKPAKPAKGAP